MTANKYQYQAIQSTIQESIQHFKQQYHHLVQRIEQYNTNYTNNTTTDHHITIPLSKLLLSHIDNDTDHHTSTSSHYLTTLQSRAVHKIQQYEDNRQRCIEIYDKYYTYSTTQYLYRPLAVYSMRYDSNDSSHHSNVGADIKNIHKSTSMNEVYNIPLKRMSTAQVLLLKR